MSEASWSSSATEALERFLGVPFRRQTYCNLAYLLLAFPLGIAYFTVVTAGLSTGIGLAVTLVGVPLVVATLAVSLGIGTFETRLATWLLDVEVDPATPDLPDDPWSADGLVTATRRLLTARNTWTSLLVVALKFVFGVGAFVGLVTAASVTGALLTMPLYYDAPGVTYTVGPYVVDTLAEAVAGAGVGLVALVVGLHVLNGLARLGGLLTGALLGTDTTLVAGSADA